MKSFPPLRSSVLTALQELKEDLSVLDKPSCPYDNETTTILKALLAPTTVEVIVEKQVGPANSVGRPSKDIKLNEEDQALVLEEIKNNLESLKTLEAEDTLETNAKIQIIKTRAGLVDQMLKMQERHTSLTKTEHFKETVIRILDEIVDEKGREQFLKRIEEFR